ncbi:MAG: hypothetical protein ABIW33_08580 [Sphingomicrobium sp.]
MIVRKVREHVAHHNWFAVAIDVGIVVAGVFLGTQASNWNQSRLDRERAQQNRAMLVDDLEANQQNLTMRRHYYEWVRSEGLKALAELGRPSSALGQQFLIDAYQASQSLPWSLKRNTYDQLIAAGQFGSIGDSGLRDRISNYYVGADVTGVNLASMPAYRERLRRAMPYAAQVQIRTQCSETISENAKGEPVMGIPGPCTITIDPAATRQAVQQVHDMPGIALDLNRQLVDLDQKLVSIDVISRRAGILRRSLEGSH